MNTHEISIKTRIKVGVFTAIGLLLTAVVTVLVNDKPYWWRPCQLVHINIDDATGLRMKSAVMSMGIEIGYLKSVALEESHVDLGICVTAPVEILPTTRAYIKGEGFLGDKFVELKPVKYLGQSSGSNSTAPAPSQPSVKSPVSWLLESRAMAADPTPDAMQTPSPNAPPKVQKGAQKGPHNNAKNEREIPVGASTQDMQTVINRVDGLVNEMTNLTSNLRQAINPQQLKETMKQLNSTLENASRTLSPQGGLNQTAQRTLSKLEDAVEQLRDQITRINQGQGSLGKIINDPIYADELQKALVSLNKLLGRANDIRFVVDVGGEEIRGYDGGRGWFKVQIWPNPTRYYLLGISVDPRGRITVTQTSVVSGGVTAPTLTSTQIEETGILITGMLGKVIFDKRLDLSIGALYGDGAISIMGNLGPNGTEEWFQVRMDVYSRGSGIPVDGRFTLNAHLYPYLVYARVGLESVRLVNGVVPLSYGAGISFDDNDIKMLFGLIGLR